MTFPGQPAIFCDILNSVSETSVSKSFFSVNRNSEDSTLVEMQGLRDSTVARRSFKIKHEIQLRSLILLNTGVRDREIKTHCTALPLSDKQTCSHTHTHTHTHTHARLQLSAPKCQSV